MIRDIKRRVSKTGLEKPTCIRDKIQTWTNDVFIHTGLNFIHDCLPDHLDQLRDCFIERTQSQKIHAAGKVLQMDVNDRFL